MVPLSLTASETKRLFEELKKVPANCPILIAREATSEFGYSVILRYRVSEDWRVVDLTEMDNF